MQENTSHAGRPLAKRAAGAVVWVIVAVLVTLGAVLVACSAPPPYTAPVPPPGTNTLLWTPSQCPPQGNCRPFVYCLYTNDVLVTESIPETATSYPIVATPGVVEYALAASNAAGRSACAVVSVTNPAPVKVASPPTNLKKE